MSPDGGTRLYGGTGDSRIEAQGQAQGSGIARVWALNEVYDKRGNAMTVTYAEDNGNGDYRPTEISYVGGTVKVTFGYENRTDLIPEYEGGSLTRVTQRLRTITATTDATSYNPANAKQYVLAYDNGASVGKSRLKSVQECGYDLNAPTTPVCYLQPTNFDWQGPTGFVSTAWTGQPFQNNRAEFADLNADGRADFIGVTPQNTALVSLSTATGYTNATWSGYGNEYSDIDGDGDADALLGWNNNWGFTDSHYYNADFYGKVGKSSGAGFATAQDWWLYRHQGYDDGTVYDRYFADFNGDGRVDMLAGGNTGTVVGFSTGSSLSVVGYGTWNAVNHLTAPVDLNGDGRPDVVDLRGTTNLGVWLTSGTGTVSQNWYTATASWYTTRASDINGDGKDDLVIVGANPWKIALSSGKQLVYLTDWTGPAVENTSSSPTGTGGWAVFASRAIVKANVYSDPQKLKLHFADFNADGLNDVAYVNNANGNVQICYFTGSTFTCSAAVAFPGWTSTSAIEAADLNGDGMADLAAVSTAASNNHALLLSTGTPDMMYRVTNGQGAQVNVTYKPLTDSSVYTKYTNAVYPVKDVQDPTYVVSGHTQSNGLGGTNAWSYKYYGLRYDWQAARSLGFYLTQTTGPDGIRQDSYFYQTRQLAGQPQYQYTYVSGVQRKYQYFARTYVTPNASYPAIVLPRLTQSYGTGTDLNGASLGTTNTVYSNFDGYGFPQTVTTTSSDAYNSTATNPYTTTTTHTYNHDTVHWMLGRIAQTSVTATAPSQAAQTRTSSFFTYVPIYGELQTETLEPNSTDAAIKLATTYSYDVFGNKYTTTVTGWDGAATVSRTATTAFDATGRFLVRSTNALGHNAYVDSYDTRFGAPTYARDVNNIATSAVYDGFGRKVSETQYANTVYPITTSISYATWSAPGGTGVSATTNTSGLGWTTVYTDILGRNTWTSSSGFFGANVWKYVEFDALGRKARETLPYYGGAAAYYTTYTYDALSRVTKVVRPLDAQNQPCDVTTSYNGLSTTVTNCKNQYVTATKNVLGWVTSTQDNGGTVTNTYDSLGNLKSVRDPLGNTSSMGYDLRGRKTSMSDPDMGSWTYAYNAFGELIRQQDAKAQVTTMTYDVLGRMKTRTRPEGTSTWTYDVGTQATGKLSSVTSPGYSESQTYDATRGLATINTRVINGASYATTTAYDSLARPSYLTYPTGFKIENRYDGFGHLAEVWSNSLTTNVRYWKANSADAQGAITNEIFGNNLTSTYVYDPGTGRIRTMDTKDSASATLRNLSFQWDTVGNLTQRSWWDGAATRTESFTYDGYLNRLTGVTGPVNKSYTYDALGNFANKSDVGNYSYTGCGNRPHAVCATSGGVVTTSFTYDANGNQLTGNGRTQTWTSFNKVKTVTKGTTTSTFAYGADDQRISKVYGTDTIHYVGKLYDKVTSGSYQGHQHYLYAGSNLVGVYISRNQGSPTAFMTYYHGDHLGSIDTVTGEAGGVAARFSFDAWGRPRNPSGTDNASASSDYRGFTKHEHDDEVGLINMNAREYDPVIGRFISADTIIGNNVPSQALNRYDYANNNPLSLIDPSGHLSKKWKKRLRKWFKGYVNYFLKPAAIAVAAVFTGGGALAAYSTAAIGSGFAAAGLTTGIAANVAAGISVVGGYAISGAAFGAVAGGAICGSDCARAGARGGAISGGVLGVSGIAAGLANGGLLGQAAGSGINGWAQTGNSEGFARGFAAGLIPQDLGFSNAYMNSGAANIGIGIARDAARGYVVGGRDGIGAGVAWGQGTNLLGHGLGLALTGSLPAFDRGAFVYEGGLYNLTGGALTLGNVVAGYDGLTGTQTYAHERGHVSQGVWLGAGYVAANVASMAVSLAGTGGTHSTLNPMENYLNPVPHVTLRGAPFYDPSYQPAPWLGGG